MKTNENTMAKQTNEQKYKTAEERVKAFDEFCERNCCDKSCAALGTRDPNAIMTSDCMAYWLSLEAEEELENCPFCGGKCVEATPCEEHPHIVKCVKCGYNTPENAYRTFAEAIAAHNRVARAVRASKEGEVK